MTLFITAFNIITMIFVMIITLTIFMIILIISPLTGSLVQLSTCHSSLSPRMHMLSKEIMTMVVMITSDSDDEVMTVRITVNALSMHCNKRLSPKMHMLNKEIVMMAKVMMVKITFDSDGDDNQ